MAFARYALKLGLILASPLLLLFFYHSIFAAPLYFESGQPASSLPSSQSFTTKLSLPVSFSPNVLYSQPDHSVPSTPIWVNVSWAIARFTPTSNETFSGIGIYMGADSGTVNTGTIYFCDMTIRGCGSAFEGQDISSDGLYVFPFAYGSNTLVAGHDYQILIVTHSPGLHYFGSSAINFFQGDNGNFFVYGTDNLPCSLDCFSNVLFLPGIEGSNLYEDTTPVLGCQDPSGICEVKRWLTILDSDIRKLYLNDDTSSQNKIYTKDVVNIALGVSKIYHSLLGDLATWKSENLIEDYSVVPYDWRLSIGDIVDKGIKDDYGRISYIKDLQAGETPYLLSELLRLVDTSKTGKVTIVAHSTGGLVAKKLMLKLRALGKEDLVDKLILVDSPEVGTPEAVKALLHGIDIGPLGVVSDSKRTRDFTRNLPGVYSLLPSSEYFGIGAGSIPIVSFDNSSYFSSTRAQYGSDIDNFTEFENYLNNNENRLAPTYSDVTHAGILNSNNVSGASSLHSEIDSWIPLPETKVIEVTGWGEYTIQKLIYGTEKTCSKWIPIGPTLAIPICLEYKDKQVLKVEDTLEGDGTVVADSAHYLSNKNVPNAEKWWVDLEKYNDAGILGSDYKNRDHKDVLEVAYLRNFIKNQISNSNLDTTYISTSKPSSNTPYTKIQVNSPLTLDLYNSSGNHTGVTSSGEVEENVPGSRYRTIGESKYVLVPKDVSTTIKLKGYADGSFSLEVDDLSGDDIIGSTTFSAIPSSASTVATLSLPVGSNVSTMHLDIDFNADNTNDLTLKSNPGGVVIPQKYIFSGFLQPVNDTNFNKTQSASVFKAGSTIPIKFQLKDLNGTITQANSLPVWLSPQKLSAMSGSVNEVATNTGSSSGTVYKYDPTTQQYIYNWSTKGLQAGYWYKIFTKLDDGNVYSIVVGLR